MVCIVPAHILVVDDNEATSYATARVLRAAGFTVSEVGSGEEGVLGAAAADLVLLDINLPDFDGFEVCRRIRRNATTANLPIIHLSATLVTESDKVHGLDSGADAYLTHPIEPPVLVATVNAFLRTRQAERSRRDSELRLRAIVGALREGVTLRDTHGELIFSNESFQRMVGVSDDPFRPGAADIRGEDGVPMTSEALAALFAVWGGEAPRSVVLALHRADGEVVWLSVNSQPIPSPQGNDRGAVVSSFVDISERQRAGFERDRLLASERAARREAESANRLKDDFLATLSHELRTPLNAIVGWAQVLGMPSATAADFEAGVEAIQRNAHAQTGMIDDLLDVSRIISGKLRMDMQRMHPAATLDAALDAVQGAARAKGIHIERDVDAQAGPVFADATRVQQIVWNLLSNAVKFTPAGGEVSLALRQIDGVVEIAVRDSGQGIAPELLPHVFERFFQVDASTTRTTRGLGLGLAIVKQLVELHGGTVATYSPGVDRGSTFTVRLPLATADRSVTAPEEAPPPDEPGRHRGKLCPRPLGGIRVLVVEDDPDARTLIQRLLDECHAAVATAANVQEGMELVKTWQPDVLISDIGMPGRDGFELIREVRGLHSAARLPAIALTAFARDADRDRILAEGFQMHVVKPLDPNLLIDRVAELAKRPSAGADLAEAAGTHQAGAA